MKKNWAFVFNVWRTVKRQRRKPTKRAAKVRACFICGRKKIHHHHHQQQQTLNGSMLWERLLKMKHFTKTRWLKDLFGVAAAAQNKTKKKVWRGCSSVQFRTKSYFRVSMLFGNLRTYEYGKNKNQQQEYEQPKKVVFKITHEIPLSILWAFRLIFIL